MSTRKSTYTPPLCECLAELILTAHAGQLKFPNDITPDEDAPATLA